MNYLIKNNNNINKELYLTPLKENKNNIIKKNQIDYYNQNLNNIIFIQKIYKGYFLRKKIYINIIKLIKIGKFLNHLENFVFLNTKKNFFYFYFKIQKKIYNINYYSLLYNKYNFFEFIKKIKQLNLDYFFKEDKKNRFLNNYKHVNDNSNLISNNNNNINNNNNNDINNNNNNDNQYKKLYFELLKQIEQLKKSIKNNFDEKKLKIICNDNLKIVSKESNNKFLSNKLKIKSENFNIKNNNNKTFNINTLIYQNINNNINYIPTLLKNNNNINKNYKIEKNFQFIYINNNKNKINNDEYIISNSQENKSILIIKNNNNLSNKKSLPKLFKEKETNIDLDFYQFISNNLYEISHFNFLINTNNNINSLDSNNINDINYSNNKISFHKKKKNSKSLIEIPSNLLDKHIHVSLLYPIDKIEEDNFEDENLNNSLPLPKVINNNSINTNINSFIIEDEEKNNLLSLGAELLKKNINIESLSSSDENENISYDINKINNNHNCSIDDKEIKIKNHYNVNSDIYKSIISENNINISNFEFNRYDDNNDDNNNNSKDNLDDNNKNDKVYNKFINLINIKKKSNKFKYFNLWHKISTSEPIN